MSVNEIFRREGGITTRLPVSSGVVSGDFTMIGQMPAVAETTRDSGGYASVSVPVDFVFDLSVKGVNGLGNSAVAVGDELFYNSGATPKINKDTSGIFMGYAFEAITSGSTSTIRVGIVAGGTRRAVATATYADTGAITVPTEDTRIVITKAGVAAMTLAAPTVNGLMVLIISRTAQAHTITNASPGFNGAGGSGDVATFGGAIGDGMLLFSDNGVWLVVSKTNVTIA